MDETLPPREPIVSPGTPGARRQAGARGAAVELTAAQAIGPYRVVEKLEAGGMGVVYKCVEEALKRFVAIKVLQQKFAGDAHYRQRFHREAQTIASLSHPAIAHIYAMGEVDGPGEPLLYIAMEFVDGPSIDSLLRASGPVPLERAISIVRDTALGLKAAFAKGIVHRDIKPSNLLLSASGSVKIVDFGLAKELGSQNSMTAEGIVLGTPHYLSPEQGRGRRVDHRSDIYSLGATFYHIVTGKPPFEGDSQVSVIVAHVNDTPTPPHLLVANLPESVSDVISRMMAKAPEGRYQDYDELVEDLDALAQRRAPLHARPAAGKDVSREETLPLSLAAIKERSRSPRRKAALAGALLLSVAAALLGGLLLFRGRAPLPLDGQSLLELGTWYSHAASGEDTLNMNFAQVPRDRRYPESWRRLITLPDAEPLEAATGPHLADGALSWKNFGSPFACGLHFARLRELRVRVGHTSGNFDLGMALVDPAGSQVRHLFIRLRPQGELEVPLDPLRAIRHGEVVPLKALPASSPGEGAAAGARSKREGFSSGASVEWLALEAPLTPVPRLDPGPFDVRLELDPQAGKTRLELDIARGTPPRTVYQSARQVEGTDWASGILVIWTQSPAETAFAVSLDWVVLSGTLASEPIVETVPWRS